MDSKTKQKITETVMAILKEADMEKMTEFMIRKQASEELGLNLSEPESKMFVRTVVESYLKDLREPESEPESEPVSVPEAEAEVQDAGTRVVVDDDDDDVEEEPVVKEVEREEEDGGGGGGGGGRGKRIHVKEFDDSGDLIICKLSNKRRVTIQDFKGKTLVSIREYYSKDGKDLPSSKGISLTPEQWSAFSKNVPAVEEAIKKMESR